MSFDDRLQKRPPLPIAIGAPTKSVGLALCMPQVVAVAGQAQGLLTGELAPLVAGGLGALRLLDAVDELLGEFVQQVAEPAADGLGYAVLPGALAAELHAAAKLIRAHMQSVDAAQAEARDAHERFHAHGKGPFH